MTWPQEDHADLGIVDDDRTEDLVGISRQADKEAAGVAAPTASDEPTNHQREAIRP